MEDWLLFLGAGASVASPTHKPLFLALAAGVLRALGWRPGEVEGQKAWIHSRYPPFSDPDLSAEVLFGALRSFGVPFTNQLAEVFVDAQPNAVHQVAASVLAAGGCVWTTNVDTAVEAACEKRGFEPPLAAVPLTAPPTCCGRSCRRGRGCSSSCTEARLRPSRWPSPTAN